MCYNVPIGGYVINTIAKEMLMGKGIQKVYFGMIIFGFLIILVCGVFTSNGTSEIELQTLNITRTEQVNDSVQHYCFDVSNMTPYGMDIAFFSHHQFVHAYADGEEIYSVTEDGGIWGRTPGCLWNFVNIPYGTKELIIEIVSAYTSVQGETHTFYYGDALDMYRAIFKSSTISMVVSFLIIISGAIMITYGLTINRRAYTARSVLYLGTFILIFGFWSFNETDSATLLFNHRITSSFSAFIFLMLMTFSFSAFVRDFMQIEDNIIWKLINIICVVHFIICLTLQFTGIMDLKETVVSTHTLMILAILYVILVLAHKLIKGKLAKSLRNNLIALIALIAAALTDMFFYYQGIKDGDFFGRFIFLIFTIILGKEALGSSMKLVDRGKKAKLYEELATTDGLTGLYNRNSYELDIKEDGEKPGTLVVLCDLNNLKKCNDTIGHSEGDKYIKTAAGIIEQVFSDYGKCYRIGGDEFLVLIKKGKRCPIDSLIAQVSLEEARYNEHSSLQFPVEIAIGYAIFDSKKDENIEKTRDRADEMMYENKRTIKQQHSK